MRKLILAFLLLCALPSWARSYNTTFPATEAPISQGGIWIGGATVGLDWKDIDTTPSFAYGTQNPTGTGYNDSLAVMSGSWGPSQTVQATASVVSSDSALYRELEVLVHFTITAHSASGYEINCSTVSTNPYIQVVRWNGALGNFTSLYGDSSHYCVNGSVLKAAITSAGVISVYLNGSLMTTVNDTTFTGGAPGMGVYIASGAAGQNSDFGWSAYSATDGLNSLASWSGVTVGNAAGNIRALNQISVGTSTGNYGAWNGLTMPSTPTAAMPTFTPSTGSGTTLSIALATSTSACNSSSYLRYTTDGSTPISSSSAGTGFTLNTVGAYTAKAGVFGCPSYANSPIGTSGIYTITSSSSNPAFVNASSCTSGSSTSCTTSWSPTAGNRLIVAAASNGSTSFTCSDNHGSTYTLDGSVQYTTINLGEIFHSGAITTTGSYTITCAAATTPTIFIIEASNISGLDSVSSGTNPSTTSGDGTVISPGSMTLTSSSDLLVNFMASATGAADVPTQLDTNFAMAGTACGNGGSCYVSAAGYRVTSSAGAYTDGWNVSYVGGDYIAIFAAYH